MTSSDDLIRMAREGAASKFPAKRIAIVTCMDARVDPLPALSLRRGDAHVIRNAGGLITPDATRSLILSQRSLGTQSIDVMMHTDCGVLGLDEDALRAEIAAEAPRVRLGSFGSFDDLERELQRGVEALRQLEALPHRDRIRGLVLDVATGRARLAVR